MASTHRQWYPKGVETEFLFDDKRWPVLHVSSPLQFNDAAFNAYLAQMGAYLERKQPHVIVFDATKTQLMSASQRLAQANWLKANRPALQQFCLGVAFVIDSMVVKGMLSAILMFAPLPYDHVVVKSLSEAEAWAHKQFDKRFPGKR